MSSTLDMTNDDLEEQGLVECCSHCYSLHITVEEEGSKFCNDCGTVDVTEIITEDEWVERNKINC